MCELCSDETKAYAQDDALLVADDLKDIASIYENLASGNIKPHTNDHRAAELKARRIMRKLVKDYV